MSVLLGLLVLTSSGAGPALLETPDIPLVRRTRSSSVTKRVEAEAPVQVITLEVEETGTYSEEAEFGFAPGSRPKVTTPKLPVAKEPPKYVGPIKVPALGLVLIDGDRGPMVRALAANGPGNRAKLKIGDVITRIDGVDISRAAELPDLIDGRVSNRMAVIADRGGEDFRTVLVLKSQRAPPKERSGEWYGWQTLVYDFSVITATVLSAFALSDGTASGIVSVMGLVALRVGPGIIHFRHGEYGKGARSMIIRGASQTLGGVLFTAALAAAFGNGNEASALGIAGLTVSIGGTLVAIILDAATGFED